MTNTRSLCFSNEMESPDLKETSVAEYYREELAEVITLALDPIERFIAFMDSAATDKTQRESDSINILYALHKNAKAILDRFDEDLTKHAGDISVLRHCYHNTKGGAPEKAVGVEILQG